MNTSIATEQLTPADEAQILKYREQMLAQDRVRWGMPDRGKLHKLSKAQLTRLKHEFDQKLLEPIKGALSALRHLRESTDLRIRLLAEQCVQDPLGLASRELIRVARRIKFSKI
jgi:hypothetical protein